VDTDTLAVFHAFTVVGLFGVYLKVAVLGREWDAFARYFGLISPTQLSLTQRLGFFASALGLNLLILPIAATVVATLIAGRHRLAAALATAAALSLGLFVELRAHSEVGQFISGDVLGDGLGWLASSPSVAGDYVTVSSLAKLGMLLAWLGGIGIVARAGRRREVLDARRAALPRAALALPAGLVVLAALVLTPVAYASRVAGSSLNVSAVARAAEALLAPWAASSADARLGADQALAAFRELTHTGPIDPTHPFAGREADSDLLIFLMETGPAQASDLATAAATLPGARRLLPHAFVGDAHYTAHPYSSDAVFSLLSGLYPQPRRRVLRGGMAPSLPGLFSSLPDVITDRGVYLPGLYRIELDDRMYTGFGARTLYVADRHPEDPVAAPAAARAEALVEGFERDGGRFDARTRRDLVVRLRNDLHALARLERDLADALAAHRRYALMFFPEIGHGPWPGLHGEGDVLARGRALMRLQDGWLGQILDVIARAGRLDHTVVVVTADHGLRTRVEYPPLPVGLLSDVTYRVPLLVHVPRTLAAPLHLPAPSSHIDVAPTILALLGRAGAAARMPGLPIWQREADDRLYLLGSTYGGADGFVEGGRYYMRQALSGLLYANDRLAFESAPPLPPADPRASWIADGLTRAEALQEAISARKPPS
jgi:hypothetical protein